MMTTDLIIDPLLGDEWGSEITDAVRELEGPILVVGASGFIGARLFYSLLNIRTDVIAASQNIHQSWRMCLLTSQQVKNNLRALDITDVRETRSFFAQNRPRTIFNLSAYGGYERQKDASKIHQVNYTGTLNLLMAAEEYGCSAFVHTGSSSEYGLNCKGPRESDELIPNSDYAASKVGASYLVKYFGKIKNLPAVNLRLYSVYGPWEDRDRLIPKLVSHGLKGEFTPYTNRETSRDFVYVDDCTAALVLSSKNCGMHERGASYNVASGIKTTLEEIALTAKKLFKISGEPKFGTLQSRRWDLTEWFGNASLIHERFEWKPNVNLERGLLLTAQWEKSAKTILTNARVPTVQKKISAIIACYRDHEAIPLIHARLTQVFQKLGVAYEIIFVNDCSPTADERVIEAISQADAHVIGVSHSRNFGSQSAFLSGMEVATGDAVVLLDGDLQDPPELIEDFFQKWNEGFDVIFGVRIQRQAPWHMQILYKCFYRVFKKMADISIPLDAGDFSLMDRKIVNHLMKLPEKDIFLRGLRAWLGFKQVGVPYVRPERQFGVTTNSFLKNIWWAKKAIFSFSTKPLEYIQRLSLGIFLFSIFLTVYYLLNYFLSETKPDAAGKGATTIILLLLGLGATQLFSISVLGDYLGKVLEEVKSRPKFVKSKIIRLGESISTEHQIQEFIEEQRELLNG